MNQPLTIRRGVSVVETIAAMALVGALIVVVTQMLTLAAQHQQSAQRQTLAMFELSNVAERIALLNYEVVTRERLDALRMAPAVAAALPDAKLNVELQEDVDDIPRKSITLSITWTTSDALPSPPVQLVIFKHQLAEVRP